MDFEAYAADVRDVVRSVKPELRGMSHADAEACLQQALRERDLIMPPAQVRVIARLVADPWWQVKHPIRSRRVLRRETQLPDAEELEAETDEMVLRVDDVLEAAGIHDYSLSAHQKDDGFEYVLVLRPYVEEVAQRVRSALAPSPISVTGDTAG